MSKNSTSNIFVEMHPRWRLLIMFYVVVFALVPIIIEFGFYDERPLLIGRFLSLMLWQILLFAPIIFYIPHKMGWLHPLILPLLFDIVKKFGKDPTHILTSLRFETITTYSNRSLPELSQYDFALLDIKAFLIRSLALIFFYLGYLAIRRLKAPSLNLKRPSYLKVRLFAVGLLGLFFVGIVLNKTGGISQNILMLAGGRFRYREALGGGHFLVLANILTMVVYLWFAYFKKPYRSLLFWAFFLLSISSTFILTGSRSSVLIQVFIVGLIYLFKYEKVPVKAMLLAGILGVLVIGPLGEIRQAGLTGDKVDWSVLFSLNLKEKLNSSRENVADREDGFRMVLARGIQKEGLLWGRTYVSAILFWVPRAIWKKKPRGAGAYNGGLLFYNQSRLEFEQSGNKGMGVPTSPEGEAYWNFYYPGVIIIYFLFGLIIRFLAEFFKKNKAYPAIAIIYILAVANLEPTSVTFVSFFQRLCLLLFVLICVQIWKPVRLQG